MWDAFKSHASGTFERKLDLMQQQEAQMVKEEQFKENEDSFKEKDEERKARDHLFNQWERIHLNIR